MHFIGEVRNNGRKRLFDPATDMPKLVEALERLSDVRLIVLDPVALAVKGGDSHKNVETRVGLQPFVDLCVRTGAAGLGIHHFTKNTAGGHPLERLSGSLAFHALPRAVLIAARDQSDSGPDARRAMVRGKVSNGPDGGGFDYKLDQYPLEDYPEIVAQRVLWGDFLKGSARDILDGFEPQKVTGKAHPTVIFLKAALAGGPRLAAELYAEAEKMGIPERSLRYHYKKLGGTHQRLGMGGPVIWELSNQAASSPPEPPAPPEDAL
jgi:putative DNA primase/helicase